MGGSNPTTFIRLSLGQIRSIRVNVMGEVEVPGTYTLSSLASLFHAIYSTGGVNAIGSLRNVRLIRNGKELAKVDVYQYLLEGKSNLYSVGRRRCDYCVSLSEFGDFARKG